MAKKRAIVKENFAGLLKEVRKNVRAAEFQFLRGLIVEIIQKGISPVRGAGRFQRYSESYREAIILAYGDLVEKEGQISPVNMTLFGDMLNSLRVVDAGEGRIRIEFDDPKAYFHNTSGTGKSRTIRRLLPDRPGEEFSREIQVRIRAQFRSLVAAALRKNRKRGS